MNVMSNDDTVSKGTIDYSRYSPEARRLLMEKDAIIAKQARKIRADTVQRLLEDKAGLPDMYINPLCTPSIVANEEALLQTQNRRKGKPSPSRRHDVAEIRTHAIESSLLDFAPNDATEDGSLIKSELLQRFLNRNKRKFEHDNVTSPQDLVSLLLSDVIRCCGIEARVVKEATMFSLRPDLVVVEYEGRLLLAVEIKNPREKGGGTIFDALETGGQIFDYLKGLRQYGNDSPIVVLSNYREMVICCLTDDHTTAMGHTNAASEKLKSKESQVAPSRLASSEKASISPPKPGGVFIYLPRIAGQKNVEEEVVEEEEEEEEPPLNGAHVEQDAPQDAPQDPIGTKFDFQGRGVTYSQIFTLKDAFHVLTLVVEAAVLAIKGSSHDFKLPNHGSSLERDLCALGKDSFGWKKFNVKISYDKSPRLVKNFSVGVLAMIGSGSTGKCLLCCTTTGISFVAKLFLPKPSFLYTGDDRQKAIEESLKAKKGEADKECRLWKELFSEYGSFCKVAELNETPALIMPYFAPLRIDERRSHLSQVQSLLKKIATSGYTYSKSDVRWSHVGRRGDKAEEYELVLLDLGSLTQVGESEAKKNVVHVVQSLKARMDHEEVQVPTAPPLVKMQE